MRKYKISSNTTIIAIAVILVFLFILFGGEIIDSIKSSAPPDGVLYAQFIDVGQGDCTLIITPTGKHILIDTGTPDSESKLVDHLKEMDVETIDYLILTHPHADHIGGAAEVIDRFEIDKVIMPDVTTDTRTFYNVLEAIEQEGCEALLAESGSHYSVDGCTIDILGPVTPDEENLNNSSIVCKLTYGKTSFMFTGDMETDYEKELVSMYGNKLKSDVLKVGHHGSSTSSSEEFLTCVSADIGIISCGEDNEYGHPHSKIIKRLEKYGVSYLRTDKEGTVSLVSDGEKVTVHE